MRKIFLVLILIGSCQMFQAQTSLDTTGLKLVSPGGGIATSKDGKQVFSFSIGELFTQTTRNFEQTFTQGYQQGKRLQIVGIEQVTDLNWQVSLYPNPTSEYVNLSFNKVKNSVFNVDVFSADGRKMTVSSENLSSEEMNKYILDFRELPAGNYVVKVWNATLEKYESSISIIKSESLK